MKKTESPLYDIKNNFKSRILKKSGPYKRSILKLFKRTKGLSRLEKKSLEWGNKACSDTIKEK